jgi:uncharacterized repeat protein (TIGR01451 family)
MPGTTQFDFLVTINGTLYTGPATRNGSAITITNGAVSIGHGDTIVISGLGSGDTYRIEEINNAGWTVTPSDSYFSGSITDPTTLYTFINRMINPDLEIEKEADCDTMYVDGTIRYTIEVTNNSDFTARNFSVIDELDRDLVEFVPNSFVVNGVANPTTATHSSGTITVVLAEIGAGETITIEFDVLVLEDAIGEIVLNTAILRSTQTGSGIADRLSEEVEVRIPDLEIEKVANREITGVGREVTYTIEVTNNSVFAVEDMKVIDELDREFVRFVENSFVIDGVANPAFASHETGVITVLLASIGAGETVSIEFNVSILRESLGDIISNIATVRPECDEQKVCFPAIPSEEVEVRVPNLSLEKRASYGSVYVGETITYTIVIRNNSSFSVENTEMIDRLDTRFVEFIEGSFIVDGVSNPDKAVHDNGVIRVELAYMEAGQEVVVTFVVRALAASEGQTILNRAVINEDCTYTGYETPDVEVEVNVPTEEIEMSNIPNTGNNLLSIALILISIAFVLVYKYHRKFIN